MNAIASPAVLDTPVNIELLSLEELQSIEGGMYFPPPLLIPVLKLLVATGAAAVVGAAVGAGLYALLH